MSNSVIRRLRGVAVTMSTWSVMGGLVGMATGAAISLGVLLPRGEPLRFGEIVGGLGLAGALSGAVSGVTFALILMLSERRRGFDELRTCRLGGWGGLASSAIGLLISGSIPFALVCGTIGFAAGASSLVVARRAIGGGRDEVAGWLPEGSGR